MTKGQQKAKDIASVMDANKGKHLGSICMWTLLSPSVASADLQALFAKHQLDWDAWGPEDLDGEVTFHKAIAEAKRTVSGWRFVTLLESKEKKVIGVVAEQVDRTKEDVKYRTDWSTDAVKITYDKVNAAVKTTNPQHPVAKVVSQTFKRLADLYTTPDFTRFLVRDVKENGGAIQLRSTGGTYFMPAESKLPNGSAMVTGYDLVLRLKAVLEACGSEFAVFNVKEDEVSKRDVGRAALNSMGEELKALEEELTSWKDAPPRADTLGRRMQSYKELKGKAEMYASMLQIKADDILLGLAACTKQAKAILGVVEKAKEEKDSSKSKKETKPQAKPIKVEEEAKKAAPVKEAKLVRKVEAPAKPTKKAKVVRKDKDSNEAMKQIVGAA